MTRPMLLAVPCRRWLPAYVHDVDPSAAVQAWTAAGRRDVVWATPYWCATC